METEFLENTLVKLLNALTEDDIKKHDWYIELFPTEYFKKIDYYNEQINDESKERYSVEYVLAKEAIKHPKLHELMKNVVEKITKYGRSGRFNQIWENEEVQAGGALACELAVFDKQYIPLYYNYIQTNDLDHEVYQAIDMGRIFNKWKGEPEIIPTIFYRSEWGQETGMAEIVLRNIEWKKEKVEEYLKYVIEYFKDQWSFNEWEFENDEFIIQNQDDQEDYETISKLLLPIFNFIVDYYPSSDYFVGQFNNLMARGEEVTIDKLIKKI